MAGNDIRRGCDLGRLLGTECTLWQTGHADIYMQANLIPQLLRRTLIGSGIIAVLCAMLVFVFRRRRY